MNRKLVLINVINNGSVKFSFNFNFLNIIHIHIYNKLKLKGKVETERELHGVINNVISQIFLLGGCVKHKHNSNNLPNECMNSNAYPLCHCQCCHSGYCHQF